MVNLRHSDIRGLLVLFLGLVILAFALGCTIRPEVSEELLLEGNHSAGDLYMVTSDTSSDGYQYLEADVSPDGQRVIFSADWAAILPNRETSAEIPLIRQLAITNLKTKNYPYTNLKRSGADLIYFRTLEFRAGNVVIPIDAHYEYTKGDPIWLDDQHVLYYIDTPRGSRFYSMEIPLDYGRYDPLYTGEDEEDELQLDAKIVLREADDDRLEGYRIHHHREPACSPNGQWVVFMKYNYVNFDSLSTASGQSLWVFKTPPFGQRATELYQLTREAAVCGAPHWAPDGSKIVFHATNDINENDHTNYYSQEIYTIDFDPETLGTEDFVLNDNLTRLTFSTPAQGSVTKIRNNDPVFSPDGGIIVFTSDRRAPTVTLLDRNVWQIPSDGSLDPEILFFSRSDDMQPTFTGNGREILLSSSMGFPTEMLDDLWSRAYARISAEGENLTEVQVEALADAERVELENFENVMHHLYRFTAQ